MRFPLFSPLGVFLYFSVKHSSLSWTEWRLSKNLRKHDVNSTPFLFPITEAQNERRFNRKGMNPQ